MQMFYTVQYINTSSLPPSPNIRQKIYNQLSVCQSYTIMKTVRLNNFLIEYDIKRSNIFLVCYKCIPDSCKIRLRIIILEPYWSRLKDT